MTFHEESLALEARFRRATLFGILSVSAVAAVVTLLLGVVQNWGATDTFGLAFLAAWTTALCVWLRGRPRHAPVIGVVYFVLSATSSLGTLAAGLLLDRDPTYGMGSYVPWLPLAYVASFLVFAGRKALLASLGVYAANIAVCGAYLAVSPPVERTIALSPLLQILLSHAAYVTLFALLGRLQREHLLAMRAASLAAQDAFRDALTDLPNRRQLAVWLSQHLAAGDRVAALLLDLDHFKDVNDRHGHAAGDAVLRQTADLMNATLARGALLGRWGGEEFMVLLPHADEASAVQAAEMLRRAFASHAHPGIGIVTASFGIAVSRSSETAESLFTRADEALYEAKRAGRGRVGLER